MSPTRAPPLGPRAANGTSRDHRSPREPREPHPPPASSAPAADPAEPIGPHPGKITSSNQYTSESTLRAHLRSLAAPPAGPATSTSPTTPKPPPAATLPIDPAREDTYRLQGVQLIDSVRERLQLPLRTFDTACVYYHRFRLGFRDSEYAYQDAALASLFVACKVEDTIKKSRDILAAAYSVRNPDKTVAPDDKIFEASGKIIIGLERLILETVGFDFRTRYPQKLLAKTIRAVLAASPTDPATSKSFFGTAYAMSIDMYKTFVPIKRTTFAMVCAITELTALMLSPHREDRGHDTGEQHQQQTGDDDDLVRSFRAFAQRKHGPGGRPAVLETMLDLLDLYVQHHKSTKLGATFDINHFMDIKIHLNNELDSSALPRHLNHCPRCEFAASSSSSSTAAAAAAASTPKGKHQIPAPGSASTSTHALMNARPSSVATMRFVFDPELARYERHTVDTYYTDQYEEYEIEVDEPIPPPPPAAPHAPRRERDEGGGGRGRRFHDRGGGHSRERWGGGGGGGSGGHYRGDKRRGRRH